LFHEAALLLFAIINNFKRRDFFWLVLIMQDLNQALKNAQSARR
jgi:hypothetical protein